MDPNDRPIDRALKEIDRLNIITTGLQKEVTFLNLQMNRFIISMNDKKKKEEEEDFVDVKRTGSWW